MKEQYKIKEGETIENYVARMAIVMDWSEEEVDIINEIVEAMDKVAKFDAYKSASLVLGSIAHAIKKGKNWKGEIRL